MSKLKLSDGKTVEIRDFKNRKIARGYEDKLFADVVAVPGESIRFPAANVNAANDYLVGAMAGLSEEEVGELREEDFKAILDAINAEDPKAGAETFPEAGTGEANP